MRELQKDGITVNSKKVINKLLTKRMKDSVDLRVSDKQTGFCKDRPSIYEIETLSNIVEQWNEWISSLYLNFLGY